MKSPELETHKTELPRRLDARGNITFIEAEEHVPFRVQRVFYLYDVPGGAERGGHALKTCHQFLVAVSGSFDVLLDNGTEKKTVHLDRPYFGLHIPPLVWREMSNFSSGSVCLALASEHYDAQDYYREYSQYMEHLKKPPAA